MTQRQGRDRAEDGSPKIVLPTEHSGPSRRQSAPPASSAAKKTTKKTTKKTKTTTKNTKAKKETAKKETAKKQPAKKQLARPPGEELSPGDQADRLQAAYLRNNVHRTNVAVAELFGAGAARTARVMDAMAAKRYRQLLAYIVLRAAETHDRAMQIYLELSRRGMRRWAVAVLLAAAKRRPHDLPVIVRYVRRRGQQSDLQSLLARLAQLPEAPKAAAVSALAADGLRWEAEQVHGVRRPPRTGPRPPRPKAPARDLADTPRRPATSGRWWFLRFLASLFARWRS